MFLEYMVYLRKLTLSVFLFLKRKRQLQKQTHSHVSVIPTEGREKQSLQLVNLEITSPAATFV